MPDWIRIPVLFWFQFFFTLWIYFNKQDVLSSSIIISRSTLALVPAIFFKKIINSRRAPQVILWAHEVVENKVVYEFVYKHADGIVGTNSAILNDLAHKFSIPLCKLTISLNPVPEAWLQKTICRKEARKSLGLPEGRPLVVYTGKLYIGQREAEYILNSAVQLPQATFVLTGGKPNVVAYYQKWCASKGLKNVFFSGFLYDLAVVRLYQASADILVSYYTQADHLVRYNYPQKITEYMLAKGVIITPNYPATQDILNAANAIFVEPENQAALNAAIQQTLLRLEAFRKLGEQAFRDVQEMTFKKRARKLIIFFESLNKEADDGAAIEKPDESPTFPKPVCVE